MWIRTGCESFIEWVRRESEEARFFRRQVLHAVAQIELRHMRKLHNLPFSVFTLADPRRSLPDRESRFETFARLKRCCTPFGFCRGLKQTKLIDGEQKKLNLTSAAMSFMLFVVSW